MYILLVSAGISRRHAIGECPKASKTNRTGYFLIRTLYCTHVLSV